MNNNDHDILVEFKAKTEEKLNHIIVGMKEISDGNNKRLDILEKRVDELEKGVITVEGDIKGINQSSMDRYASNRDYAATIKIELTETLLERTKENEKKFTDIAKINDLQSKNMAIVLRNMYLIMGGLMVLEFIIPLIIRKIGL